MTKEIEIILATCADAVEDAKSGHPGAPLDLSQFIHFLFTKYLNLNPDNARRINRDLFILPSVRARVIQHPTNNLLGLLPYEELLKSREANNHTPVQPEKNQRGIETTKGPLGRGVASSVGFAISSKLMQKCGLDNKIFRVFGDGCYQEGITQEAISLCSRLNPDNITFFMILTLQRLMDQPTFQ